MNALPTLSLVTISYNQIAFLPECVDSVLRERDGGLEYIVVDPGSDDGSRVYLAAQGHRIDRLIFEPDRGPADGLNKGFAASSGDILGYLNSDDRLAPGAIAHVRDYFARHPDVDVLCGAIRIIDERGRPQWRRRAADAFDARRYVAGICTVGQQATFFRRRAFVRAGGFNVDNRVAWDGELLLDLALSGARFARTRRTLGDFRIYPGTITGSQTYMARIVECHRGFEGKLAARGLQPIPPRQRRLMWWAYKANPLRHLVNLLPM